MIRKLIINQPGGQYLLDLNLLRLQVVQPILNWFLCALAAGRASRVLPSHCEKNDFPFVCDKPQPLNFALTVKVLDAGADQTISLLVNGTPLVQIPASDHWTTKTFSAPANLLCWGINQVEICWPTTVWSGGKQREHIAERLEAGEPAEITPIFGLIHSFRVSPERN